MDTEPEPPPEKEDPQPAVDPGLDESLRLARADLAQRTGLPAAQITVREARWVTWPDGSLGCPQPGQMYAQALVPGLLIRLVAGGRIYEYHRGRGGAPFLCDPVPPGAGPLPSGEV